MSQTATNTPEITTRRAVANTLKGSMGNLVEWYDVYTYTVFQTYFEGQFFNSADKNSTIYASAGFAVTFLMRPVGSWFFGRYADRHGRRTALTMSVSIMAAASLVIALLPTRTSIGVWAAVLLMLCRLVQGFATGGEYGTSATYMSEAATQGRRGFFSSFQYVTLVGGQVIAQLVLLIMTATTSTHFLQNYGWRIAFGIGGVAAVVVFWLRRSMDESLPTDELDGAPRTSGSLKELFTVQLKPLVICFLFTLGGTVAFYTFSVKAPALVKAAYKNDASTGTWINLLALTFLMLLQPLGGYISDRIGRKALLVYFGVTTLVWTYFLITYLPKQHNPMVSFAMLAVSFLFLTGYTSINAVVKSELFPAYIRALGVGLGYGLANSMFGGTSPLIYDALQAKNMVGTFIIYVCVCVAISLVCYCVFLKNGTETHLDREHRERLERAGRAG